MSITFRGLPQSREDDMWRRIRAIEKVNNVAKDCVIHEGKVFDALTNLFEERGYTVLYNNLLIDKETLAITLSASRTDEIIMTSYVWKFEGRTH